MGSDKILLGHGGGGRLTAELLGDILQPLHNPVLDKLDDSAEIEVGNAKLAFTTDSYVIDPLEFPGGDIGRLAVCGTVNDLTMQGARPAYLSLALIVEEGLSVAALRSYIRSVGTAAEEAGVEIATGDTKVVERGHGSGLYINTAGLGVIPPHINVGGNNAAADQAVIVTGPLGDHGIAIMSHREGLEFETAIVSDAAPLNKMIGECLQAVPEISVLRDPTRGGLTAALCDIAVKSQAGIRIREKAIPVRSDVKAACDLLGLDALNIANEGKAVIICPQEKSATVLAELRKFKLGKAAAVIGEVNASHPGTVILETNIGGERILTPASGENLPRIC